MNHIYLLELRIELIDSKDKENDELFKDYHFLDVPGLSENVKNKEETEKEIQKDYVQYIFPRFKQKFKFFFIEFDAKMIKNAEFLDFIKKIKLTMSTDFKDFYFKDSLFFLHNIYLSESAKENLKYFKTTLLRGRNIINYNENEILPIEATQLLNEAYALKDFHYLMKYFFHNFKKEASFSEDKDLIFSDFIKKKIEDLIESRIGRFFRLRS